VELGRHFLWPVRTGPKGACESVCVRERERVRERTCVCVCLREREKVWVCGRGRRVELGRYFLWSVRTGPNGACESVCVCERERESVCVWVGV